MAQSKDPSGKEHAHSVHWKEQQHKYAQTAKDMFEKFSEHAKSSKPDHAKVIEHHKKNLEALSDSSKMAADVMKSLASMQSDFVKKTFEDINAMMRELMTQKPGQPIDMSKHAEAMKNSLQRATDHTKNMGSMLSNSSKEIHAKIKSHLDEAKEDIREHVAKHSKH
ncbi:MAG: phasin family protein [Alphaproteobacteria bacterium]